MNQPHYQAQVTHVQGVPAHVTLRLVHPGGPFVPDFTICLLISQALATATAAAVSQHMGWSQIRAMDHTLGTLYLITGYVQATNLVGGGSQLTGNSIPLRSVNVALIEALMAKIQESNADLGFYDIEWAFIIDPNSLVLGGAAKLKPPPYVANSRGISTWSSQTFNGVTLNCAAYALAYAITPRPSDRPNIVKNCALGFMTKYGWGSHVSAAALQEWLLDHDAYRLTILLPKSHHHDQLTFVGRNYVATNTQKRIYLVYDVNQNHYGLTYGPGELFGRVYNSTSWRFCHDCLTAHGPFHTCRCEDATVRKKSYVAKECTTCHKINCDTGCPKNCSVCGAGFKKGYDRENGEGHRCIVYSPKKAIQEFWKAGDPLVESYTKGPYMLWAYDLEAAIKRDPVQMVLNFETSPEGGFALQGQEVKLVWLKKAHHDVNLVVFRNVFDPNSEQTFFGPDCLDRFIQFMLNHNGGRNICVAHNGSGYDSRLVFEAATKYVREDLIKPLARGCKFLQLQVGRTIFRDSMLHLPGSLANLAVGFFGNNVDIRKGHFPHLFNSEENYDYVGPLPEKHYFDIAFMMRNQRQLDEFNAWHDERSGQGPWSFRNELEAYCQNDVKVLAALMLEYHTILVDKFKISPWFSTTAPAYVHTVVKQTLSDNLDLPDREAEPREFAEIVENLAMREHWAVLLANEYWFARKALRGGRTDVRKVHHRVSNEDWAKGVRIRYQDIVSMYPYVQVAHDYPVGLPTVHVWDDAYYPCFNHRNPRQGNNLILECGCTKIQRERFRERMMTVLPPHPEPTVAEILADKDFFGIVCASLTPPTDLYHPVLVMWDEDAGKCIATLQPIKAGVFTSVEFKKALEKGYRLDKLHRFDQYHKAPGLWNPFIKNLYIEKMANSEPTPTVEVQNQLVQDYETFFGMGESVASSFNSWGDNPAKRQVFKIMLNSGWGKHCQRAVMGQMQLISHTDQDRMRDVFENASRGKVILKDYANVGMHTMVRFEDLGESTKPNLHDSYLPAGLFVPAYGRMMLYEQLDKLGERVLYHDTDSIVYIYEPTLYNIPESDVWGKWSVEKFDYKNGGIRAFTGMGPKTYGMEAENGEKYIKAKGLSIKLAHGHIINYDVMEKMVTDYLETNEPPTPVSLPQFTFNYRPGNGMSTHQYLKQLTFKPKTLKGDLHPNGQLFPFGYCPGCFNATLDASQHTCV